MTCYRLPTQYTFSRTILAYFCKLAPPSSTSNTTRSSQPSPFLCSKMSEVNDKYERSTGIAAPHSAEPTRKRKDPPGTWLTPRNHKRTNIAHDGTPTTDPKSYAIATRTKCFRISGIPQDWKEHDLLSALQNIDPDLGNQKSQLSLYPACCGSSQTALLDLDPTKYLQSLGPDESYIPVFPPSKTEAVLTIDSDFYGLTPLNTPDKRIIAELVASCPPESNQEANA